MKATYLHQLLDEDEDARLDGFDDPDDGTEPLTFEPRPTFKQRQDLLAEMDLVTRANLAHDKRDEFFRSEA